jgi:hypothetical protein
MAGLETRSTSQDHTAATFKLHNLAELIVYNAFAPGILKREP